MRHGEIFPAPCIWANSKFFLISHKVQQVEAHRFAPLAHLWERGWGRGCAQENLVFSTVFPLPNPTHEPQAGCRFAPLARERERGGGEGVVAAINLLPCHRPLPSPLPPVGEGVITHRFMGLNSGANWRLRSLPNLAREGRGAFACYPPLSNAPTNTAQPPPYESPGISTNWWRIA